MAFREGLLQKVDLMGMADLLARQQSASRNEKNKTGDMADQAGMQQLLQWGIPATEENLRKLRGGFISGGQDTMTLQDPMLKGTNIGSSKTFLSDLPGYISGTPGAQVSAERNAAAQAMIGAMGQSAAAASRAGGGGGGGNAGGSQWYGAEGQAANEKYGAPNIPFGYGSGNASLLAEQKIKSEIDQAQKNRDAQVEIARLNSEGRNVPSAKSPTAKTSQSEIMSSGALAKIDELKKSDKFNELPIETQNAAFSDSEISKLFNDNTIDIEDIIIRLIIKYGGRPGPTISATNRKTGKQYSSEPTGDVSTTVEFK
jgi:hypothetical protein